VISAPNGHVPRRAALLDHRRRSQWRHGGKTPVAVPVLAARGRFRQLSRSLMGSIAYVRQVWLDTDWSTKAQAIYSTRKSARRSAARYDRTEEALPMRWKSRASAHPLRKCQEIRPRLGACRSLARERVLYGGQMGYEVANQIAVRKIPVLIDLKWP